MFEHTEDDFRSGLVGVIGPPNAGKSTLTNRLVGDKVSIVTDKPQTTRNRISGILNRGSDQIVFLDTPGIHQTTRTMNQYFVETAWRTLAGVDAVLLVLDCPRYLRRPDAFEPETGLIAQRLSSFGLPLIVAANKTDAVGDKKELLPLLEQLHAMWPGAELFPVSAREGQGTGDLLEAIRGSLPPGPPLYPEDQLSTLPMRFLATEIIREKLFGLLTQELPYSIAVASEYWKEEPERGLVHLGCVIYVERRSHKGIVIGKGGSKLKQVGREARLELEELLEIRIHLQLWVKVKPGWTEDRRFLANLEPEE
jgi:GTP-binding protein Era